MSLLILPANTLRTREYTASKARLNNLSNDTYKFNMASMAQNKNDQDKTKDTQDALSNATLNIGMEGHLHGTQ